jgi:hypothetical protein
VYSGPRVKVLLSEGTGEPCSPTQQICNHCLESLGRWVARRGRHRRHGHRTEPGARTDQDHPEARLPASREVRATGRRHRDKRSRPENDQLFTTARDPRKFRVMLLVLVVFGSLAAIFFIARMMEFEQPLPP